MSLYKEDLCDDYGFHFLDNVDSPILQLTAIGKQSRYSKSYYWDNRNRPNDYLFQYTLSGSGTLQSESETYHLKPGDAFLIQIPSNEIYYFDEEANTAPWEFIFLMFHGAPIAPYYEYIQMHFGKVIHLSEYHPAIRFLFELHQKAKQGLILNAFTASSDVFHFLCLLCESNITAFNQSSSLIDHAREYLQNNMSSPISLAETALHLGVSESHLSREFVKCTGEQLTRYLTKLRLERAVELLHTTEKNLNEISKLCGFESSNYFNKVFKKYMKITPSAFRHQFKIQNYVNVKV